MDVIIYALICILTYVYSQKHTQKYSDHIGYTYTYMCVCIYILEVKVRAAKAPTSQLADLRSQIPDPRS